MTNALAQDENSASVDPRVSRSRAAILEATAELLIELGAGGVTIERVAGRSSVAKTTIYRHWRSRSQLIFDAFESLLRTPGAELPEAPIRDLLVGTLDGLRRGLTESRWAPAVAGLIEAADRDPEMRVLIHDFLQARMAPVAGALRRAADRGELRTDLDADLALGLLAGSVFYRRLISREPLDRAVIERWVDLFLSGATQPGIAPEA